MNTIRQAFGFVAALLSVALLAAASPAGPLPADIAEFLTSVGRFSAADLASLEAGRVIARAEAGSVDTEMIALAAVKIRSTREQVVAYYGQMVSWVDGEVTLGFGRFSTPPTLADVSALTLDRDDLNALRSCKPGDCDLRIGAAGAEAVGRAVNWQAPDAADQAHRLVRQALVDYVAAYQARGDEALVTYDDRSKPVRLVEQWREIVAGAPYFHQYQPALRDFLTQYPRGALTGARSIVYWIKEDFGLKPTISLVHAVIYQPPGDTSRTTVVQKQIYASHYYDGSLAVATIAGATEEGRPVTYLVYGNRSRGDLLKGGFGGLKRSLARDQARKAAEETLDAIRTALEKAGA